MGDCIFWIYPAIFIFLSMSDIVLQVFFSYMPLVHAVLYDTKNITVAHCEAVRYKTFKKILIAQLERIIAILAVMEIQQ